MHWNTGYQAEALPLLPRFVEQFRDAEAVVVPRPHCVAHDARPLPHDGGPAERDGDTQASSPTSHALLPARLGVLRVPHQKARPRPTSARTSRIASPTTPAATACARSASATAPCSCCAASAASTSSSSRTSNQCCGFGGTFAVKNADVSSAMLDRKDPRRPQHQRRGLHRLRQLLPDAYRRRPPPPAHRRRAPLHLAEILASDTTASTA